jgi:hypothetical protein
MEKTLDLAKKRMHELKRNIIAKLRVEIELREVLNGFKINGPIIHV